MSRALLLNASYEPHLIIPARRMVRLYMDEKVEPIEFNGRRVSQRQLQCSSPFGG